MESTIRIIEKPASVSWEAIRQCLNEAHAPNRAQGIDMAHYQWSAGQMQESLGERGFMLLAMDGEKLVGTAAISDQTSSVWYAGGRFGYLCFGGVIPAYAGRGVFRMLEEKREALAKERGFAVLVGDTHVKNKRRQSIARKNGYRIVRYFRAKSGDHFCVVIVKWLNGCPYSSLYCRWKYLRSWVKAQLR